MFAYQRTELEHLYCVVLYRYVLCVFQEGPERHRGACRFTPATPGGVPKSSDPQGQDRDLNKVRTSVEATFLQMPIKPHMRHVGTPQMTSTF